MTIQKLRFCADELSDISDLAAVRELLCNAATELEALTKDIADLKETYSETSLCAGGQIKSLTQSNQRLRKVCQDFCNLFQNPEQWPLTWNSMGKLLKPIYDEAQQSLSKGDGKK